jgi:hypothetical protein
MSRLWDLANPADDPVRTPAGTSAPRTIACSPCPHKIAGVVIVVLVLLSGVAYVLGAATGQI